MVRGHQHGSDELMCVGCGSKSEWVDIEARAKVILGSKRSKEDILKDFTRESQQRDLAILQGVERPFLLLVAMHPFSRHQLASYLGFSMFTDPSFGDCHKEAWVILNRSRVGTQARCNSTLESLNPVGENCTYYDMLSRVMLSCFGTNEGFVAVNREQSLRYSSARSKVIGRAEAEFLRLLVERTAKHRAMIQKQAKVWKKYHQDELAMEQAEDALDNDNNRDAFNFPEDKDQDRRDLESLKEFAGLSQEDVMRYALNVGKHARYSAHPVTLGLSAAQYLTGLTVPGLLGTVGGGAVVGMLAPPLLLLGIAMIGFGGLQLLAGAREGTLFEPLIMIVNQRMLLALDKIDISQYQTVPGANLRALLKGQGKLGAFSNGQ